MYQKSRRFQTKIITYAVLVIFSLLVIGVFVYSYVSKYQEDKLDIKSRYTFSIRIDEQWNVVSDDYVSDYDNDNVSNLFHDNGISDIQKNIFNRTLYAKIGNQISTVATLILNSERASEIYDIDSNKILNFNT